MRHHKNLLVWIGVIIVVISSFIWFNSLQRGNRSATLTNHDNNKELYPEDKITHGHKLAVDIADSNKLYIATHHGLFVLINEKDLYRVGQSRDDYMGFSSHPTHSNTFFSSSHPAVGGNLGFQKSADGGITWERIASGLDGPVDFHAMAVSPVNPDLVLGWYKDSLQRSEDGGKRWAQFLTAVPFVALAAAQRTKMSFMQPVYRGFLKAKIREKPGNHLLMAL